MLPVIWHHGDNFWDCALPRYILDSVCECKHAVGLASVPMLEDDLGVIVIPGRHSNVQVQYDHLCDAGSYFKKVIYVIIGDEEGLFQADKLEHPHMTTWWFMPPFHPKQKVDRVAPNGWPSDAPFLIELAKKYSFGERPYDWNFMGQVTHSRRIECVNAVIGLRNGRLLRTEGFTKGEPREKYYATMVRSKTVLCPSGPCTPDSFRFAEALESGCIPIVDNLTQNPTYPGGYWNYIFSSQQFPFPVIDDWTLLREVMYSYLKDFPARMHECQAWWLAQKYRMIAEMKEDLYG